MPGIPPAPTQSQFEQIAKAIDPNASVISTRKLVGGISCRMDVLEICLPDTTTQKVVTRQYWESRGPQSRPPPRGESAVLRTLTANQIPAPRVIVTEDQASEIFGRPAIVISYLEGVPDLAPTDLQDWASQLARAIAKVHAIEVPDELKSVPRSHIDSVTKWMGAPEPPEKFVKHESGVELWHAMRGLWPGVDTSASQLIHTDFWPGNTLWKNGKLLAIVDWEWPALGEPIGDVAYFLSDAAYAGFDIEKTFLDTYEQASGRPVHDLLFWKMMATAIPMPDIGGWAQGYAELGIRTVCPDDIRHAHSEYVQNLLAEFHSNV
ncbi:MAG: phosphotransferase [Chloroflexi bacterium]|nr:phosphotransferase [Chloroflexota bacterium]